MSNLSDQSFIVTGFITFSIFFSIAGVTSMSWTSEIWVFSVLHYFFLCLGLDPETTGMLQIITAKQHVFIIRHIFHLNIFGLNSILHSKRINVLQMQRNRLTYQIIKKMRIWLRSSWWFHQYESHNHSQHGQGCHNQEERLIGTQ